MSGEQQQRSSPAERVLSVGIEVTMLALTWRALDGPDPRELARQALDFVRRPFLARAAMRATLQGIRDLPETEGGTE